MSCDNVQERISSFVDGRSPDSEREDVLAHVASCRDCSAYLESTESVRRAVVELKRPQIPAALSARLRVLASHERTRQLTRISWSARLSDWSGRIGLAFNNAMRPLAFPFAGGIASALILFGLVIPTMTFEHALADQVFFTAPEGDVVALAPSGGYAPTESENPPWLERAGAAVPDAANVVDLTIDQTGRVSDFTIVRGELTPDLTSIILLGKFSPATNTLLGMPTTGRVRAVQIRNVHTPPIHVRS
jgi:anti-sigma factor RsiW